MEIYEDAEGEIDLLLGNESIARGAIEAGVDVVSSYPGTPASEIITLPNFKFLFFSSAR